MKKLHSNTTQYLAHLKSIEQQINQDQLQEAAQQLNLLVKTDPHDPRLFLLGSRLAEAAHNPQGVLEAARKAHELALGWPTATIYLAGVLASHGEAEEAMSLAEQAIQQGASEAYRAGNETELLTKAAALAQRLGLHTKALQWLRQAEQINPDNLTVRHQIGRSQMYSGDPANAVITFTELLQRRPNNPALLNDRLRASLDAQQTAQAILDGEALVAMEPDNEVHQFYLDIARGVTPKTQPAAVVTELFDGYAASFDRSLVIQLKYKLPRDVAQMIHQWHPDRKGDVLDLGCGTGLLGVCLGRIEGALVGVDLSAAMIEQAGRHRLYGSFHRVNVLDALRDTPENLYHVIAALDVLIYIGDLATVIPNAQRILLPGGRFVFSCETGAKNETVANPGYSLQSNYRYTHQPNYVQGLLEQAGFEEIAMEDRVLRYERDEPVAGILVTARKPLKPARKSARRSPKNAKLGHLQQ